MFASPYHIPMLTQKGSSIIALLACKVNNDNCCYDTDVPKELVKIAKQATMNHNRAHSSKFTS